MKPVLGTTYHPDGIAIDRSRYNIFTPYIAQAYIDDKGTLHRPFIVACKPGNLFVTENLPCTINGVFVDTVAKYHEARKGVIQKLKEQL